MTCYVIVLDRIQRILKLTRSTGFTARELSSKLNLDYADVRRIVTSMEASGLLKKDVTRRSDISRRSRPSESYTAAVKIIPLVK